MTSWLKDSPSVLTRSNNVQIYDGQSKGDGMVKKILGFGAVPDPRQSHRETSLWLSTFRISAGHDS
jgi:hypothetical protein